MDDDQEPRCGVDHAQQVAAGIARLDDEFGGRHWVRDIDVHELNVEDFHACVLALLVKAAEVDGMETEWTLRVADVRAVRPGAMPYFVGAAVLGADTPNETAGYGLDIDVAKCMADPCMGTLQALWVEALTGELART